MVRKIITKFYSLVLIKVDRVNKMIEVTHKIVPRAKRRIPAPSEPR